MGCHYQYKYTSREGKMKLNEAIDIPINEVDIIQKYHQSPLKDSDTIRVYHGAREPALIYQAVTRGLSGGKKVPRVYSYENNNNPKGLFVTPDLKTAKQFGHNIIEFHTRVSDLEIPVWPGGTFTVAGQLSQMFNSDDEREKERLKQRMRWSESEYMFVRDSDRPEVAAMLLMVGERQALFTGDLNANSVRAIWVSPDPKISSTFQGFNRVSPKEFIQMYQRQTDEKLPIEIRRIPINPRDDMDGDEFVDAFMASQRMSVTREKVIDILLKNPRYIKDRTWSARQAIRITQDLQRKYL